MATNIRESYKDAKTKILEAWPEFRMDINDYLPEGKLDRFESMKEAYCYYDEFDNDDIEIIQRKFKTFGNMISDTVIGDHCRGDIYRAQINLDAAAKDNNIDGVLRAAYELFVIFRGWIITLERIRDF